MCVPRGVFSAKICERCVDGDAEVARRWIVAKKVRDPCIDGDDLLLGYFSATEYLAREDKGQSGRVRRESKARLKCGT
jgi:hypothetical protein